VDNHYQVLDINLLHPIKISRIAIRRMLAGKAPGVICCVSSIAAQAPSIITPLYHISKAGVSGLVRSLSSLEDLEGIRIVGVAPGVIRTPLFFDHPEAERFLDKTKDVMLEPEDIARAMMALCTDETKYQSGTVLEVTDVENWREVRMLNDPGPQGKATVVSNKELGLTDVRAILERDKHNGRQLEQS
jgi:3-hydroxybutyrate dehydrogenase